MVYRTRQFFLTVVQGVALGITIGLCQGVALDLRKGRLSFWLIVNCVIWIVIAAILVNYKPTLNFPNLWPGIVIAGTIVGLFIGIPQSLLLHKGNHQAGRWILACVLGYMGGLIITALIVVKAFQALGEDAGILYCIVVPFLGLCSSIISGIFLLKPMKGFDYPQALTSV